MELLTQLPNSILVLYIQYHAQIYIIYIIF